MQKRACSKEPHCLDRYRLASEAADLLLMQALGDKDGPARYTLESLATVAVARQLQALRLLLEERLK